MVIVTISGSSGSGKTAVKNKLVALGFKPIISYTTRQPRGGEVNGVDYNFVTREKFNELFESGSIIEKAEYSQNLYGLSAPVGGDKFVAVVETSGVKSLKELYLDQVKSVLLDVPDDVAELRRNSREQMKSEENSRRSKEDVELFKEKGIFDYVVDASAPLDDVVAEILNYIRN